MKKFETPDFEIEKFGIIDVITTSGECADDECADDSFLCPVEF